MSTLIQSINSLGALIGEPAVRAPDYIENYARLPDLRAFTAQERQWIREAEALEAVASAARGAA